MLSKEHEEQMRKQKCIHCLGKGYFHRIKTSGLDIVSSEVPIPESIPNPIDMKCPYCKGIGLEYPEMSQSERYGD